VIVTNKYKEGAAPLQAGVTAMLSGIAVMRSSIAEQTKEKQAYIRDFYG